MRNRRADKIPGLIHACIIHYAKRGLKYYSCAKRLRPFQGRVKFSCGVTCKRRWIC